MFTFHLSSFNELNKKYRITQFKQTFCTILLVISNIFANFAPQKHIKA